MKNLALTVFLLSVPTVAFSAPCGQGAPATEVEASVKPVAPASAHRGLMDCLGAVSEASDGAGMRFYSLRSKVVPATEDEGELVAVEMEVGFHAASGSLAEAAFDRAQAALIELKKETKVRRFDYGGSSKAFIHAKPFPGGQLSAGAEGGTHNGTLRIELPAAAVSQPSVTLGSAAPEALSAADRQDPGAFAVYARGIAAGPRVSLPLTIAKGKRGSDEALTFEVRPAWKQGSLREVDTVDRPRIVNLMYLLEAESRRIDITSVEIAEPAEGDAEGCFRTFEIKVRQH